MANEPSNSDRIWSRPEHAVETTFPASDPISP
ncbi:hypothetical protein SAMN05216509_0601 [Pseudomonas sp. B10]|nr:hypothetical protein SAMN05216509_0601 [Pseudomonas sp. B10]